MSRPSRASVRAGAVVALALVLSACGGGGSSAPPSGEAAAPRDVEAVLEGLADEVVVPSHVAFAASADELAVATAALCDEPSDVALVAAQDAWRSAIVSYQQTRGGAVGPAMDRRLLSAVAFEARPASIDELLAGDEPVDAEGLSAQGAAVRGLYAAEHVLFGDRSEALVRRDGARSCQYVAAVAELVAQAAAAVTSDWVDGDAREGFVTGDGRGPHATVAALTNEVSRRLGAIVTGGLRDMSEASTIEELPPGRGDGPAGYAVADWRAVADGAIAVIGDEGSGLAALVAAHDPDAADRLLAAAQVAGDAMAELDDSVADAFADPGSVDEAAEAVAALEVLISTEVASKLGVTMTFSDSDGDG